MTTLDGLDLEDRLAAWLEGGVVVAGLGNPMRGDDAAGSAVARRLGGWPGVFVVDAQEVPENYLETIIQRRPQTILLVDSVDMGAAPGSIALLDREQFTAYWPSTHRVPMSVLMGVLEHETHARIFAIGIQPGHTDFLQPMSDAVAATVAAVAGLLNRVFAERMVAA